ncbi:FAD-dependent oxidoreductase [Saccharopolyspora sp. ID03-671]|uniref:NAD(P)/FAD-dependent oxidoreductase n=1 Tax=Saccharopolyspora sp. ID03-671 TaxID=3073066 RepID=UPI003244A9E9
MSDKVVVVGGGLACARLIQALQAAGFRGRVIVIGDEQHPPYDRPPLSKGMLVNDVEPPFPHLLAESDAKAVDWTLSCPARSLDTTDKQVELVDGRLVRYDTAVLATGCRARPLPIAPQLNTLRTADDAFRIRRALVSKRGRLLLVGAGFIGSELAAAAVRRGWEVDVVDTTPLPLQAALGEHAARWLWQQHRSRGVRTHFGTQVQELFESDNRHRAVLSDGTGIAADLAVAGIGTVPNVEWLHGTGLDISDGVLVDQSLRALKPTGESLDGVLAIGDVARAPTPPLGGIPIRVEHWSTAGAHARIAAATILERPHSRRSAPPTFWTDFYDHRIQVVGSPTNGEPGDPEMGGKGFAIDFHDNRRLVGTVSVNWPARLVQTHRELTVDRQS